MPPLCPLAIWCLTLCLWMMMRWALLEGSDGVDPNAWGGERGVVLRPGSSMGCLVVDHAVR
jgi:hypothetical protein